MSAIYLEDVLDRIGNKYLAVNVAAQRARALNERGISMLLMGNAPKPVTIALEELVEGKLGYKELDQPSENPEDFPFTPFSEEEDDEEILEEFQSHQEYFDDSDLKDPDEPEEGL
jgi:DNA-directed RNA polymerase omega subunit